MNGKVVARGVASAKRFRNHSSRFDVALGNALKVLDGKAYASKELRVVYSVQITPNPGGVGEYVAQLEEGPVG